MPAQRMLTPYMILKNRTVRVNRVGRGSRYQEIIHQGEITGHLILLLGGRIIIDAGRQAPVSEGLFVFQVEIVGRGAEPRLVSV